MVQIFNLPFREHSNQSRTRRSSANVKEERSDSGVPSEDGSHPRPSTTPSRRPSTSESSESDSSSTGTPPYPFPHRATPSRHDSKKRRHGVAGPVALRRQHISNLYTVLQVSMGRQDYARAYRAWALLLRSKPGQAPSVDLRTDARWGIGVELLLWRGVVEQQAEQRAQRRRERMRRGGGEGAMLADQEEGEEEEEEELKQPKRLNRRLFAPVKEYYQRLILDYTAKARRPNALDFYPAMYGLWIQSVAEEFEDLRSPILDAMRRVRVGTDGDVDMDVEEDEGEKVRIREERIDALRQIFSDELVEIRELMLAMDDIVLSPPYSDDTYLVGLRRQVGQWAEDTERRAEQPELAI